MSFDGTALDRHLAGYVDDGRLAGWELGVTRFGEVVHTSHYGWRDREGAVPVDGQTVWRIASMTKPITAVAAMRLWEQKAFALTDPVSRWIPAFADAQVYLDGPASDPRCEPVREPIQVWHLLSHTSGLTAGFLYTDVVDQLYREAGYEWGAPEGATLASCVEDWARLPLRFHPGSGWGYGVSSDVLGRLIEIWSGQPLDEAFATLVTDPLGMVDTGFRAGPLQEPRLPRVYQADPATGKAEASDAFEAMGRVLPAVLSGGGGLTSTLADYTRFTRMLACEGSFEGSQLLEPHTVRMMRSNQLAGDLAALSASGFSETTYDGIGFGLGFANVVDPVAAGTISNPGEYYWGGAFSTQFWVDPVTGVSCVFMCQLFPSTTHKLGKDLRDLVYAALQP